MNRKIVGLIEIDEEHAKKCAESNMLDCSSVDGFLKTEFGWLEESGLSLKNWILLNKGTPHSCYIEYLIQWAISHSDEGCRGMSPACYDEWCDCEALTG